jgi:hypothetical protein
LTAVANADSKFTTYRLTCLEVELGTRREYGDPTKLLSFFLSLNSCFSVEMHQLPGVQPRAWVCSQ